MKRLLKWIVIVSSALFILLSLLPYIIPLQLPGGSRHELAYDNSEFADIEGVELHFRRWVGDDDSAVNVLLVHGLGGSTFTWRYTAPVLQVEGYRVTAVDLHGFGLSERQAGLEHNSEAKAERLWLLLEKLYPKGQWHLVGHSMGGGTVTAMALQEPGKVKSVTLAAGALAEFEPSLFTLLLKYPPVSRWIRVLGPRLLFSESWVEQALASAYGRQPTAEEIEGYYYPLTIEDTDVVFVDLIKTAPAPLLDRVGELDMPVLCIWGEDDAWVSLEQGEKLIQLIPHAELAVIAEEGHCPMETSPDLFNTALLDFIKTAGSR